MVICISQYSDPLQFNESIIVSWGTVLNQMRFMWSHHIFALPLSLCRNNMVQDQGMQSNSFEHNFNTILNVSNRFLGHLGATETSNSHNTQLLRLCDILTNSWYVSDFQLRRGSSVTFWNRLSEIHTSYTCCDWPAVRRKEISKGLNFYIFFFSSFHNNFCHFWCVQPSARLWIGV